MCKRFSVETWKLIFFTVRSNRTSLQDSGTRRLGPSAIAHDGHIRRLHGQPRESESNGNRCEVQVDGTKQAHAGIPVCMGHLVRIRKHLHVSQINGTYLHTRVQHIGAHTFAVNARLRRTVRRSHLVGAPIVSTPKRCRGFGRSAQSVSSCARTKFTSWAILNGF